MTDNTSSPNLLTRLSHSPASSTSSLTSSSSFDPHADPDTKDETKIASTSTSQVLGLRELARMRRHERRAKNRSKELDTATGENHKRTEVRLVSAVIGQGTELPFTREVVIKGWKVVGGKSWTDLGRIGAYVVYDIEITLQSGGKINILRRYTDFENLRSCLKNKYPAFRQAIPPLPGKAHMSRFSEKFLAERQPRLQRFLRGVMLHPEMGRAGDKSIVGRWVVDADAKAAG